MIRPFVFKIGWRWYVDNGTPFPEKFRTWRGAMRRALELAGAGCVSS